MLLPCKQPQSTHFLPHQKVLNQVHKRSPYNWSLCCLALFLAQKKMYFSIVELFKDSTLYLFLQKGYREKNAVIAVVCRHSSL